MGCTFKYIDSQCFCLLLLYYHFAMLIIVCVFPQPINLDVWQNSLGYFTMNRKCANSPGTALLSDIWTMASVTNKYQMSKCVCGNISCLNEMDSNQSSGKDLITRWLHFFSDSRTLVLKYSFGHLELCYRGKYLNISRED